LQVTGILRTKSAWQGERYRLLFKTPGGRGPSGAHPEGVGGTPAPEGGGSGRDPPRGGQGPTQRRWGTPRPEGRSGRNPPIHPSRVSPTLKRSLVQVPVFWFDGKGGGGLGHLSSMQMWGWGPLRFLPLVDTGKPLMVSVVSHAPNKRHETKSAGRNICIIFMDSIFFPNDECNPHLHKSTHTK